MGGFTRVLHTGQPDDLMDEIPTFVAQPLPQKVTDLKGYVVLNRCLLPLPPAVNARPYFPVILLAPPRQYAFR